MIQKDYSRRMGQTLHTAVLGSDVVHPSPSDS